VLYAALFKERRGKMLYEALKGNPLVPTVRNNEKFAHGALVREERGVDLNPSETAFSKGKPAVGFGHF